MRASFALVAAHVLAYALGLHLPLGTHALSLIGYAFTHASSIHLALNMLAMLGLALGIERTAGPGWLLGTYVAGVIGAGCLHMAVGPATPVVGASGGVAALLVFYAALYPRKRLWLVFLPLPAAGMVAVVSLLAIACVAFDWLPGVAHWAHLGGAVFGALIAGAYYGVKDDEHG